MPRKNKPNIRKLKKIKAILKKHPEGLWVRELSRKSGIDKSAISRYVNKDLDKEIETKKLGVIKIIKLKTK